MKQFGYVNGQMVKISEPQVKLNDLALLRGYAVFDFVKVIKGKPLFWPEHLARFRRSAKRLGLAIPKTDAQITLAAKSLIKKNNFTAGSLRLILTGGETADGLTPSGKTVFAILAEDSYTLPEPVFKTGGKLITVDYERLFPSAKTTNYLLAVSLLKKKLKAGAIEILYVKDNHVFEASTSNFFLVFGNKIVTPKDGVLPGITRAKVIGLAKKLGYKVEERKIKVNEIKRASEAFLTATNKDVAPIINIDGQKIGNGKVGEVTKSLLKKYRKLINS